jgi:signal transduction histidine kinase
MIFSADYPRSSPEASSSQLVFTHNAEGQIFSFCWSVANHSMPVERIIGGQVGDVFVPVELTAYLDTVKQVLATATAQQFRGKFYLGDRSFWLDLVISPVLLPNGSPTTVVVTGESTPVVTERAANQPQSEPMVIPTVLPVPPVSCHPTADPISAERYHKLLTQIASNIRRTLDLPTIWQQTVEGLGKALGVNRCIVCPYEVNQPTVKVMAEYCRGELCPMQGLEFLVADDPDLSKAIATLHPVNIRGCGEVLPQATDQPPRLRSSLKHSMLIVTTSYQDQPNGLIVLYQDDQPRRWTEVELEFIQELADQVGTAIAHATLIANSQALAEELRKANSTLLQQHRELEEAREQAEEASRLKSEFLANTSHEVRTPLNGILGCLNLILDGTVDEPEEQIKFIRDANKSALHLLSVLDDILDIAKLEAGKLRIELAPVKLRDLLNEVKDYADTLVRSTNLSFEIQDLPTNDEIIVYGNYQRLVQVMLNLVGNAFKFTHEGGVTVSVEILKKKITFQEKDFPGLLKIRVADTGIGVSLDRQDRLFQSFSQVDGSRTRRYGGTGLGLVISQSLVEAMGGTINFYSMGEGLGSTVTFTVPLYQEPLMISSLTMDSFDLL